MKLVNGHDCGADSTRESIRRKLRGTYATDIPLIDFVKNVFDVEQSVISSLVGPGSTVTYSSEDVADSYRRLSSKGEAECCPYPRFFALVEDLLPAVFDVVKKERPYYGKEAYELGPEDLLDLTRGGRGVTYAKHGISRRKLDVLFLNGLDHASYLTEHPGEREQCEVPESRDSTSRPLSGDVRVSRAWTMGASGSSSIASSNFSSAKFTEFESGNDDATPLTGTKRARSDSDATAQTSSAGGHVDKRPRTEGIDSERLAQLTECVIESLGSTERFYHVAFLVDNSNVCLAYVDHMVSLRSEWIDFIASPHLFSLMIVGFFFSTPRQAGCNPFLQATPVTEFDNSIVLPQTFPPVASPLRSFFAYKYPGSNDHEVAKPTSGGNKPLFYKPRGLFGRATTVYGTLATFVDRCVDNAALEGSWQPSIREESNIIDHLRKENSDFKVHFPEVLYSAAFSDRMGNIHGLDFEKRKNSRIIASPMYQTLWEVKTVEELQKAWLDAFKCHHVAWKTGEVLHRDVSENNIMFLRRFFKNDETVVGILNDWDMASFLDEAYNLRQSTAKHRTGTLPFMSELLLFSDVEDSDDEEEEYQTVHHSYCHDVESFFWVLLWAFIHYPLDGTRRKTPDSLSQWISDDTEIVSFWKHTVLTKKKAVFNRMLRNHAFPHFQELKRDWLVPLYDLIAASRLTAPKVELTYEAVMKAIGEEA
ncbi:other/FunK1 protein kinase [Coprinopsis cinerea AmutBmut pab1-1]|nr:other/FunK1 protein kinase [Coprinopsis cinerea AmutBmut pab1-1]